MPNTLHKLDSLRHYSSWLLLYSLSKSLLHVIHPEIHFNTTSAAPGFSISNLDEIKGDATECSLFYWSGSLDLLYPLLSGTQLHICVTKINPAARSQSNPQQRLSLPVRVLQSLHCDAQTNNHCMNKISILDSILVEWKVTLFTCPLPQGVVQPLSSLSGWLCLRLGRGQRHTPEDNACPGTQCMPRKKTTCCSSNSLRVIYLPQLHQCTWESR